MTVKLRIFFLTILALSLGACSKLVPNGTIVTQKREHSNFDGVKIDSYMRAYVEQGDRYEVELRGSENIINTINTEVIDGILHISAAHKISNNDVQIFLVMPQLKHSVLVGSGDIKLKGPIYGDTLWVECSGSGDFRAQGLYYEHLHLESLSNNNFELEDLHLQSNYMSLTGNGKIEVLDSESTNSTLETVGKNKIEATGLATQSSHVSTTGKGHVDLAVSDSLWVSITGKGKVHYVGQPVFPEAPVISGNGQLKQID